MKPTNVIQNTIWIVILAMITLVMLGGCGTDQNVKTTNPGIANDNDSLRSQRYLHEKKYAGIHLKSEQDWDSLNMITVKKTPLHKGNVHPDIRTFGWHLYSNGSVWKNYNLSMLWGLSYFSYAVQPKTGSYTSIHQWKTTTLIDSAKAANCKVFLSVSNFGHKNNAIFLDNPKAQHTLIDSLSSLLALRSADGINIDFEGVSKNDKVSFTKFIVTISKRLKEDNPNYNISLCLYAEDWNDIFDITTIDPYIDFYTLMGYDYYGGFSKTTGPVTPLNWSTTFGNGLKHSVQYYQNKGVHLDKLIVGLPYYGAEWNTEKPEPGSKVLRFRDHPPYKAIRKIYIDSLQAPVQFDSISTSSYIVVPDRNNTYRQLFFEDQKSLGIKYDWIKNNKIKGVGIWALGYDDGYPELWNLLIEKFSAEQHTRLYTDE